MAQIKEKNVLITAKAYKMLIEEYNFEPNQLLAKIPANGVKINSPKSGRFISVGSISYMSLLETYNENELLMRRDGYIISPESHNSIKVFGKTFNNLINSKKYTLIELLSIPRVKHGNTKINKELENKMAIIELPVNNDNIHETGKDLFKVTDKKINKVDKKLSINKLLLNNLDSIIIKNKYICIYNSAIHFQHNKENNLDTNAYYYSCHFFENGILKSYLECSEQRTIIQDFSYRYTKGKNKKVNNYVTLKDFMLNDNSNELKNIKLKNVDIMSLKILLKENSYTDDDIKEKINKIIQDKYKLIKTDKLFKIIESHMWFESHMILLDLCPNLCRKDHANLIKGNQDYELAEGEEYEKYDDQYENFEEIKNLKASYIKDVNKYHKKLVKFIKK
jgi:hypothetical protein